MRATQASSATKATRSNARSRPRFSYANDDNDDDDDDDEFDDEGDLNFPGTGDPMLDLFSIMSCVAEREEDGAAMDMLGEIMDSASPPPDLLFDGLGPPPPELFNSGLPPFLA